MHVSIPSLAQSPHFAPESRVWVYVSNRPLTDQEAAQTTSELQIFCQQWTAHNQALKASAEVFENQFIILMVDETQAGASGCSIDKSVHFLEQLGQAIGADFFERMRFAWVGKEGELHFANRLELSDAVKNQTISDNTLMVNSLVQSKQELTEKWLVPYSKSWHRRI